MIDALEVPPDLATLIHWRFHWRSRTNWPRHDVDPTRTEQTAADLLIALGMELTSENLVETPGRTARPLIEMTNRPDFDLTTVHNDEKYDKLVLVQGLPLQSLHVHHMLPFVGVAHVGYLPGERILSLSKFTRLGALHARRPQAQGRLTKRIADHLQDQHQVRSVGVGIEAEPTCMGVRGAGSLGARTTTSALFGQLRDVLRSRAEFLSLTKVAK